MKAKLPAPQTSSGLKPKAGSMLSANVIFNGRFVTAFTPLDSQTAATLPATFFRYLIDDGEKLPSLNYTINTQYDVDANGLRRPKHIQREIIRLEQADLEQRRIEEALEAKETNWRKQVWQRFKRHTKSSQRETSLRLNFRRDNMIWLIKLPRNSPRSRWSATIMLCLQPSNRSRFLTNRHRNAVLSLSECARDMSAAITLGCALSD